MTTTRKSARNKKELGPKVVKEKFNIERELQPVVAKTQKQKEYLQYLNDPNIKAIIVLGLHGTGKTYCAAATAADHYRKNQIEQIIVSRAYVQTGKSSGLKPGTALEKLYPYVRNVLDTIKSRIGVGAYEIALKDGCNGAIEVQEVESIRGRSFDKRSWLMIDEAQQTTPEEMQSIVTRVSDDCKLILMGDVLQKDIKGQSGLEWFMSFAERHHLEGVAVINFDDPEEIVRGGLVKDIAIGLAKDRSRTKTRGEN